MAPNGGSVLPAHAPPASHAEPATAGDCRHRRTDDDHVAAGTWAVAVGVHAPPEGIEAETLNVRIFFVSHCWVIGFAQVSSPGPLAVGAIQT